MSQGYFVFVFVYAGACAGALTSRQQFFDIFGVVGSTTGTTVSLPVSVFSALLAAGERAHIHGLALRETPVCISCCVISHVYLHPGTQSREYFAIAAAAAGGATGSPAVTPKADRASRLMTFDGARSVRPLPVFCRLQAAFNSSQALNPAASRGAVDERVSLFLIFMVCMAFCVTCRLRMRVRSRSRCFPMARWRRYAPGDAAG